MMGRFASRLRKIADVEQAHIWELPSQICQKLKVYYEECSGTLQLRFHLHKAYLKEGGGSPAVVTQKHEDLTFFSCLCYKLKAQFINKIVSKKRKLDVQGASGEQGSHHILGSLFKCI